MADGSNLNPEMRVMVLSSDPANTHFVLNALGALGLRRTVATDNGLEAIRSLAADPVDLVVVDTDNVRLVDGLLFVKEVKLSDKVRNVPMMLIGDAASPAAKEELQRFGVVDFLKIPCAPDTFHFMLSSTLAMFHTSGTKEFKYSKAKDALIGNDTGNAIGMYTELRGLTNRDLRSSIGLAQGYEKAADAAKADAVIAEIAAEHAERSPQALLLRLKLKARAGDTTAARALIDELHALTPDSPFYYNRTLVALQDVGATELVEFVCDAAIRRRFELFEFHFALAESKYAVDDFRGALRAVDATVAKFGRDARCLNLKGTCLRRLRRFDEAIETFEDALRLAPMDAKVYYNLAVCAHGKGDLERAKQLLGTCLKIAPSFKRAADFLRELTGGVPVAS
jgi:tetratricopeptide (TPR) repeat protein